jgi:hypothetical protein
LQILGIDLDISPFTLKEWEKLNPDLEQALTSLMEDSRDFNHQIPCGYLRNAEDPRLGDPVATDIHIMLQVLDRVRFQESLLVTESIAIFKSKGVKVSTTQSIQNLLDRMENELGLLPELPKSVDPKARDNRQRLEWRRKRRIATRDKDKKAKLLAKRKTLDKQINKETKRRLDDTKKAKMSLEELKGESTTIKINRLKNEAKSSRFTQDTVEVPDDTVILFTPTPKQAEFLAAPEKVVFYGGAAGGGKSYALIFDAIRYAHRPAMRALILRRRNSELKELISVSQQFYKKLFPGAHFNQSKMIWYFPSGATLEFGYFEKETDKERYIGLPYSYIAWDEIQLQKSPEGFDFLFSRLRTTDPEIDCYVRCTGNPGGAPWVKQRFIDPAPYNTTFARYSPGEEDSAVSYKFIPATLFDNPYLTEDGEYEKTLKQMPKARVQQLLYGDWDTVDDGFFGFDKAVHIKDEKPPMHWPIISSMDYGWVDPASCLWAKVNPMDGSLFVYRELEMIHTPVEIWAQKIRAMEAEEQYVRVQDRVIDHTLFKMTGHTGPSHLETLNRFGIVARPADRQRESGWEQVNQRLLPGITGEPTLYVHESCKKLIDQLMSAQSKITNPNDIDDVRMFSVGRKHHWDLLDCLRYMCMARPKTVTHDSLLHAAKANKAWEQYNSYFS